MAQIRTPAPPAGDDDTELIPVVTPERSRLAAKLALVGGAVVGLVLVAGIIVSVLTMSGESTRSVTPEAPLTPISVPAHAATTTGETSAQLSAEPSATDTAAPSYAPLPPVTATAQTMTTAPALPVGPSGGPRVLDRLHELFPRLFPETP
ncbi:hypothetical protein [Mycolicibacterium komossense]|uniref:Uncharacterized protein n=1 Tax=Mycolicibacterium komossense TaxID=1779 RepID=A0ABT3C8G3_9MYCO|nr:hypothetical protein [Mycolicibacterium komossense]MCV7225743.1 hypothetical protein [Mycolicibacterium komossense]